MTNVEKARTIGILDDLMENYTEKDINDMSSRQIMKAWLEWEGIIGYESAINRIFEMFHKNDQP